MEPLCTKANIKPFKQAGLVSQSTAICFFNLICVATSLTILSKWLTEYQTEEQELMSHTHTPVMSMKEGAMMDQMKAAPLTVCPSLLLVSLFLSHPIPSPLPPLIHLGCPLCEQADKRGRRLAPIPHSAFPYRDKWLSLWPLAEGLALLTNGLG